VGPDQENFRQEPPSGGDSDDKVDKIVRQLNAFTAGLDSIKETLADGVTAMRQPSPQEAPQHDGFQAAAEDVLTKMNSSSANSGSSVWTYRCAGRPTAERAAHESSTLISVLEEQFRANGDLAAPMTHGDKARGISHRPVMERFEIMVADTIISSSAAKPPGERMHTAADRQHAKARADEAQNATDHNT